jgi:uncharacterized protein (TIGR03067 family)
MPTEIDKLQGTWRVTSLETDGGSVPTAVLPDASITVRGDRFKSVAMGETYAGTIALFPRKQPKAFDLFFTSGPPEGTCNRGIYVLDGDTWKICLATRGDARPRSFKTRPDSGLALEILQRGRAARKRARSVDAAPPSSVGVALDISDAGEHTAIEGEWQMVSAVLNGKRLPDNMVRWCKRLSHGNVTQIVAGPQTMLDARFRLDPIRGEIDYVNRSGVSKGKAQAGIYDLVDGILRICTAAPGDERPAKFESSKGDGRSFTVWRRSES